MKKLILTVAVIGSMFSLTACGESPIKKEFREETKIMSPTKTSIEPMKANIKTNKDGTWTQIGNAGDDTDYYIDFNKIDTQKHIAWTMMEVKSGESKGDVFIDKYEFNCETQKSRILSGKLYNEKGIKFFTKEPYDWEKVPEGTFVFDVMEYACSKHHD